MGTKVEPRAFLLGPNLWPKLAWVSGEENSVLERSFTAEELEDVLLSMKVDSAPGLVPTGCFLQEVMGNAETANLATIE
jgi:hypothetical protein